MKALVRIALGALVFTTISHADAIFSDSEFSNGDWELITYAHDSGGQTTATRSDSGGNPGAYRSIETTTILGGRALVFGFHRRVDALYSPPFQGAIDHIDYSESSAILAGFAGDQITGPALRQNDQLYFYPLNTGRGSDWHLVEALGLRATNFTYFDAASPHPLDGAEDIQKQQHPDFTRTGAPIEFGFFRARMGATSSVPGFAETFVGGIDNWSLRLAGPSIVPRVAQQAYLKASNTGAGDQFGGGNGAVAISGDTLVVGAIFESSNATGINGVQTNNGAFQSGAAYVFAREGTNWKQQAYLKASNTRANSYFGWSVAISGDTIIVGAEGESSLAAGVNGDQTGTGGLDSGAAYIFVREGTNWHQQAFLKASNPGKGIPSQSSGDLFGHSVALSGDIAVVGAAYEGSKATGINGDQSNNSAVGAGAAYVFVRNGTNWTQEAYLKASNTGAFDQFGYAVAISADTAVVSANFEASSATGVNGDQTNNKAENAGAAYVFVRKGTNWSQQAYLKASNTGGPSPGDDTGEGDDFGNALAISGNTIVITAPGEDSNAAGVNGDQANNSVINSGAAYVFVRDGTNWSQQAYLKASIPQAAPSGEFGQSVGISGDTIVVGTGGDLSNATGINGNQTNRGAFHSGAAWVFTRNGTNWSQLAYLKASNTAANDEFGLSAAVSDGTVVVGSYAEDSNATGINGDQGNNSAVDSGAAYVFSIMTSPTLELSNELVGFGHNARMHWPLTTPDFVLEEAESLNGSSGTVWTQVPRSYLTNVTENIVTIPVSEDSKFYRLRQP